MKVIPLTEEQSAEMLRLSEACKAARQQQLEAFHREKDATKKFRDAVEAIAANGTLTADAKYIVAYEEFTL